MWKSCATKIRGMNKRCSQWINKITHSRSALFAHCRNRKNKIVATLAPQKIANTAAYSRFSLAVRFILRRSTLSTGRQASGEANAALGKPHEELISALWKPNESSSKRVSLNSSGRAVATRFAQDLFGQSSFLPFAFLQLLAHWVFKLDICCSSFAPFRVVFFSPF